MISADFLVIFSKFWSSGLLGCKREKNSVCPASYLRNQTSYDYHLWYIWAKWWYLQALFHIFKFWFSGLLGVKGQKLVQNEKKLSLVLNISGAIHYMIIICGTQVQNENISIGFLFLSKVWFKGQKLSKIKNKLCPLWFYMSGTIHHMIFIYGTHVLKHNIWKILLRFFQILIFGVNSGRKVGKNSQKR